MQQTRHSHAVHGNRSLSAWPSLIAALESGNVSSRLCHLGRHSPVLSPSLLPPLALVVEQACARSTRHAFRQKNQDRISRLCEQHCTLQVCLTTPLSLLAARCLGLARPWPRSTRSCMRVSCILMACFWMDVRNVCPCERLQWRTSFLTVC